MFIIKKKVNNKNFKKQPPPHNQKPQNNAQQSPGLINTLGQGMAWGAGSSIGHSLIYGIFGSNKANQEKLEKEKKCKEFQDYYMSCQKYNYLNYDTCDFIKKDLKLYCDSVN